MIGLLVMTHETLGHAFNSLACHFFGNPPEHLRLLNISKNEDPDVVLQQAQQLIDEVDHGSGVLLLTDIFGATPFNIANKLIKKPDIILLTGLNAPMMVKAIQYAADFDDLEAFAQKVKQAALDGIIEINLESLQQSC